MNLRDSVAAQLAWVMAREETYRADGMAVPEPVRRLKALAEEVQDTPAQGGDPELAGALTAAASRLGIATGDPAYLVREMEKLAANGAAVREIVARCDRALKDASGMLLGIGRELGGLFIAGEGSVLPAGLRVDGDKDGQVPGDPIPLRHGLLLKQRKTGHRALFSEAKPGEFVYQWVAPDGKGRTDPTGTTAEKWRSDTWEVCDEAMPAAPIASPAQAPSASSPEVTIAATPSSFVKDWTPSAEDMTKSAKDLKAAMDKAGTTVEIDVPRLVERFKAEKGEEVSKRPAMAFYHWAVKALRG